MAVYYNDEGDLQLIAGSTMYADNPIGSILPYGGTTAPSGWFLCQGQALSRTEYADLFKAIGTNFGAGNGSTTFNIPDLRGEFLRGAGTNSHTSEGDGGTVGQHQNGTRLGSTYSVTDGAINLFAPGSDYNTPDKIVSQSSGVINMSGTYTTAATTALITARPTNTSVNYIIKAKQVGVPADFMNKVEEVVEESYSMSEVKTNKTWINGKPIYRRVFEINNPVDGTTFISNVDVINSTVLSYRANNQYAVNLAVNADATVQSGAYVFVVNNEAKIYNRGSIAATKVVVILEYTKTN